MNRILAVNVRSPTASTEALIRSCAMDAKEGHYVVINNGKRYHYSPMNEVLCGHMQSECLFWKHISSKLRSLGFLTFNPEGLCVKIKIVGGEQSAIVLHIDDLKISHVDKEVMEWAGG